jgi:hypothetical protein
MSTTIVWHYTVGSRAAGILDDGFTSTVGVRSPRDVPLDVRHG